MASRSAVWRPVVRGLGGASVAALVAAYLWPASLGGRSVLVVVHGTSMMPVFQPGDLLFWGDGGSRHVAMYIGGGLQIAATHTGDYVRIQPVGSDPIGASRPG